MVKNKNTWSLGFLLVIISYRLNIICPPSSAGIGRRFKTPRFTDIKAVIANKAIIEDSLASEMTYPIAITPPTSLLGIAPWINFWTPWKIIVEAKIVFS